jgi:serine/threonine-protein kinase
VIRCGSCTAENGNAADSCVSCGQPLASRSGPLSLGAIVASRYEIRALLGQGGMGVVYKAYDRLLEELVALKVLRAEVATPELSRRFRDEIRLARRVSHRNVCRIHEYGEDGPLSYISMTFVDGVDLKRILRENGPLSPTEALEIAEDVAAGLQAIHDEGIVHRDLKTANLMRDQRGVVRLMDFGIAKDRSAGAGEGLTSMGVILGTPDYMSPEQASGARIDARSDLYALGIVVYELLTGRVPFRGDTPMATLLAHVREPLRLDTAEAGAIPAAVRPILTRALAKPPAERFATAREMGEALAAARHETGARQAVPQAPGPTLQPALAPTQGVETSGAPTLTRGAAGTRTMVRVATARTSAPQAPPARSLLPLLPFLAGGVLVLGLAGALVVARFGSGGRSAPTSAPPASLAAGSVAPTSTSAPPATTPATPATLVVAAPPTLPPSTIVTMPATAPAAPLADPKPARVTAETRARTPPEARAASAPATASTNPAAPVTAAAPAADAAWTETRTLADDAARPEHERIAALRKYVSEAATTSLHRGEAESLLSKLQQDARARLLAPPDPASLGRSHRALYAGGTLSLAEGSEGAIAFPDRERMLFVMASGRFLVVPYRGVSGIEYGLTSRIRGLVFKKRSHYLSLNYEDAQGEPQGLVLELSQDDFRPVLTMLEARTGRKVQYQDPEAAKNRWR